MIKPFCDCLGCAVDGPCVASPPPPKEPDPYVEARLGLIEELFGQIFGILPPDVGNALAIGYNERRAGILEKHLSGTQFFANLPKSAQKLEKSLLLVPKH